MLTRFLITGRRWFQTTYGNTYHSVQITDLEKKEIITYIPFRYGYGNQYRQTAYDELVKLGLVEKSDQFNYEMNRKRFIWNVVDVPRKRDL